MNIPAIFQPGWKWVGIALLLGALLGALAGWWVTDNKLTADIATLKQQNGEDLKAVSDEASALRDKNAALEHSLAGVIARSDQQHTQELNNALTENKNLRDAVTYGNRQLRLAKASLATCTLSASTNTSAPGLGNAATVQFTPEFGSDIYDIRAGIISDQQKLKSLQDYVRAGQDAGLIAK
ncbi:MAG: lysis protein [Enterobacteriaceae bacterium]|nr:lysis protein [Enterobacteriaceae bacterium]